VATFVPTLPASRPIGLLTALLLWTVAANPAPAQVFFDDFNTGTDTGWTPYDPLAGPPAFNTPGSWSFPGGNTYRIQAAPTPSLGTFGPGRAGSIRTDLIYSSFAETVDVVAFNGNNTVEPQSFGLAARFSQLGLGTTNGYLFLYDTDGGVASIYRVDGEQPVELAFGMVPLDPSQHYRFAFQGALDQLMGQIYDLASPTVPLLTVMASDGTYASGFPGLVVIEDIGGTINGGDATYDNFSAAPTPLPEPGTDLLLVGAALSWWIGRRRSSTAPFRGVDAKDNGQRRVRAPEAYKAVRAFIST